MHREPRLEPKAVGLPEEARLLYDLVAIPSPSGQEGPAARFLVDWMAEHGFRAYVDAAGSAVGIRGSGGRDLALLGHIDTVPGEVPLAIRAGKLYGRGAVDAKGPLAAFALAAAALVPPPGTRLVVIGASGEESASSPGARHAMRCFSPAACLVGEPSGWQRVTLGYKGRLQVEWSFRGPLAHSAGPQPSAAERAVAFWLQVQEYLRRQNGRQGRPFDRLDVSLRRLNSSESGGYGAAHMQMIFRLPLGMDPHLLEEELRPLARQARLSFAGHEAAYLAPKNTPLVRALLRSIRRCQGDPKFVVKTGTSDMNVVGPVWDCPIAAYGPGDAALDHTPYEHIDLAEFSRAVEVLRGALQEMLFQLAR